MKLLILSGTTSSSLIIQYKQEIFLKHYVSRKFKQNTQKSFSFTGAKEYDILQLKAREMTTKDLNLFLQKHFTLILLEYAKSDSYHQALLITF